MLSDEEKKVELKSLIEEYELCFKESKYEGNIEEYKSLKETYKLLKNILNLIEKQSKEIEDLKGKNNGLEIKANELYNLADVVKRDYIHKDKIKAKIEELNNTLKNTDEIEAVFIIKQQQVLQSLLEKE